ncbi:MAG: hypothetical protein NVSMB7_13190 [Chitinophagaceae bacterium]
MQELIQSLQEKIGLSSEQAKDAASHFVDFIKNKLPESLHSHVDSAVSGGTGMVDEAKDKAEDFLKGATGKISGLFGGSKE